MCAEYTLKTSERDLGAVLGRELVNQTADAEWDRHFRLYSPAPIVSTDADGQVVLTDAGFSLLPRGGRVPFTANTRLDDWDERTEHVTYVYQRPTWRDAFLNQRCVIPASEFLEPIYEGEHAGQMVAFRDVGAPLTFIAGIFKETADRKTGERYRGFSMLTDYAHPFVRQTGHHRTVITLSPAAALRWIKPGPIEGARGVKFLVANNHKSELRVRTVREMKNWRARVKAAAAKGRAEDLIRARVEPLRHPRPPDE